MEIKHVRYKNEVWIKKNTVFKTLNLSRTLETSNYSWKQCTFPCDKKLCSRPHSRAGWRRPWTELFHLVSTAVKDFIIMHSLKDLKADSTQACKEIQHISTRHCSNNGSSIVTGLIQPFFKNRQKAVPCDFRTWLVRKTLIELNDIIWAMTKPSHSVENRNHKSIRNRERPGWHSVQSSLWAKRSASLRSSQ